VPVFGLKLGVPTLPAEERGEGAIKVAHRLSKDCGRNRSKPVVLGSKDCYFAALRSESQTRAARLSLAPKVTPLLKGEVVNEPPRIREGSQRFGLLGSGVKPIAEGALNHCLFLAQSLISQQGANE
jgi:hypothetical protein